jgi:alkaline phosphatase D
MGKLDFYDRGPDRPWSNPRLTSAAIVGHTTDTSTRLWVRVQEPGKYWLMVSDQPIPAEGTPFVMTVKGAPQARIRSADGKMTVLRGPLLSRKFSFDDDLTGVFDVGGLAPGGLYHYAVFFDGERKTKWELPPDPQRRSFRLQPGASADIRFGLISCHMPYKDNGDVVNMQMWDRLGAELEERQAHFLIGAGDQVYTDGNKRVSIWRYLKSVKDDLLAETPERQVEIMRSWFRDIYRGYWGFPQLRNVLSRFPTYQIWDDHEIMDGWGSYTTKELGNRLDTLWEWQKTKENVALAERMFQAAKLTYQEYQHSHNPATPTFDYSFTWGGYAFYVLDMRGQRDFTRKGGHKILGKDQMKRVLTWLDSPQAKASPALFIVSPVPVVHVNSFIVNKLDLPFLGLADDLRDEWDHESNWKERDHLLNAVFDHSDATGRIVAFLSGDVHIGGAFRLSRKSRPKARVFQLTSSGITYPASALLKFAVKDLGRLAHRDGEPADQLTAFNKIHVMTRNNFGIVAAHPDAPPPEQVSWDLYGSTGEEDEIVRLKRIWLS